MITAHQWKNRRVRNKVKEEINSLRVSHEMEWLTPYQCRVEGILDLYPTNRKFHNLITGHRGIFADVLECIENEIREAYL